MANLVHISYLLLAWATIVLYLKRTQANRFRTTLRLLQIIPAMFALDLVLGFTLIDQFYGSHDSASWMSKSVSIYPALFVVAIWFMFRSRRLRKNG